MEQSSAAVVRNLDYLGRVVIPKEVRQKFEIELKDSVEFFIDGEKIAVKKYAPGCVFCGSLDVYLAFRNKPVCASCINDARKQLNILP